MAGETGVNSRGVRDQLLDGTCFDVRAPKKSKGLDVPWSINGSDYGLS